MSDLVGFAVPEKGWHVATPTQQGIWILDRIERLRPTYLIPSVIEFRGPVDHDLLVAAVRRALGRHAALRSRFRLETTRRRVEYRTDGEPGEVGFTDVVADGWTADEVSRLVEALCYTPFELDEEAPARAEVIGMGDGVTLLVLTVHHIVFDATSRQVLLDEVSALYRAGQRGEELVLPPAAHPADVPLPVADDERIAEVVDRLRGAPTTVTLPYDRKPDGDLSMIGALVRTTVDDEVTAKVMAAAAQEGCTAFMVGVALLAGTLARRGGQRDFLFSVVWPGRDDPASAGVVGMFMSTLVLRVRLDENTTWRELLRAARTGAMDAFVDSDVPLDALAAALDEDRDVGRLPLTPVLVNMADSAGTVELADGVVGRYRPLEPQYSKWDLALFVHLHQDSDCPRLELSLDYPAALFEDHTTAGLLAALRRGAADLARSPEEAVLEPANTMIDLDDPTARLELVRSVWCEVLTVDHVDDNVSFFDAGGDSLRLVLLVERLRQASGREVKTLDLFRVGTVQGQADLLASSAAPTAARSGASGRDRLLGGVRGRGAAEPRG
jgi:aryl carrier-like protein